MKYLILLLIITSGASCEAPEVMQPCFRRDFGIVYMIPNPYAAKEDQLEFSSPGFRDISGSDTSYFRMTATQTTAPSGARVDTIFIWQIPQENFKSFKANQ